MNKKLKINFVVNTTGLTGGIRVVFIYANLLKERGHDVRVIYPFDLSDENFPRKQFFISILKRVKYFFVRQISWFDLKCPVLRVPRIIDKYLPDADVIIATANETADWVSKLSPSKGEKVYFIQSYETWTRDKKLVDATWKMPFHRIVIASWLKKIGDGLEVDIKAIIPNGVDPKEFYCDQKVYHKVSKILLMAHKLEIKGTRDALKALALLKKDGANFELTIFSAYSPKELDYFDQISDAKFIYRPMGEQLRKLYCDHDIFVSPSWLEGCQLPPMEAMSCGCAVVATNVGGVPDYITPEETALVVEPKQPEKMALQIKRLLENETLLKRLSKNGQDSMKMFSWGASVEKFEKVLFDSLNVENEK